MGNYLNETDFLCERRLKDLNPDLHMRFRNSVFAMDRLLTNYKSVFPFYTNHTFEHSQQVLNYCNLLAGADNIMRLNAHEIYVLLMGAALHDIGMGISRSDFNEMKSDISGLDEYYAKNSGRRFQEVARDFHQEFSAAFIKKYGDLFEIPSDEHLYCICQIARGHRKANLLDKSEYNPDYTLSGGEKVRLPYLSALVKLADELDIAQDRNLFFDYAKTDSRWSKKQEMCFKCHEAIKRIEIAGDRLSVLYYTDDPEVECAAAQTFDKVQKTYREFADVVAAQSEFELNVAEISFVKITE